MVRSLLVAFLLCLLSAPAWGQAFPSFSVSSESSLQTCFDTGGSRDIDCVITGAVAEKSYGPLNPGNVFDVRLPTTRPFDIALRWQNPGCLVWDHISEFPGIGDPGAGDISILRIEVPSGVQAGSRLRLVDPCIQEQRNGARGGDASSVVRGIVVEGPGLANLTVESGGERIDVVSTGAGSTSAVGFEEGSYFGSTTSEGVLFRWRLEGKDEMSGAGWGTDRCATVIGTGHETNIIYDCDDSQTRGGWAWSNDVRITRIGAVLLDDKQTTRGCEFGITLDLGNTREYTFELPTAPTRNLTGQVEEFTTDIFVPAGTKVGLQTRDGTQCAAGANCACNSGWGWGELRIHGVEYQQQSATDSRVLIFGDSYNTNDRLKPYLEALGFKSERIWTTARGGARSPWDSGSTCSVGGGWVDCDLYAEAQTTRIDGACRVTRDHYSTGNPTCFTDLPLDGTEVCFFQLGVNDVGRGAAAGWETTFFDETKTAMTKILSEAQAQGIPCVVATSFSQIACLSSKCFYPERDENLRDLRDWQRDTLIPSFPGTGFVDLIAELDAYRAKYGDEAFLGLYDDCQEIGGDEATCADGVHPGNTPNSRGDAGYPWQNEKIAAEILRVATQNL